MKLSDKIYVAGHRGLVGSAIVEELHSRGYRNLAVRTRTELDLTDSSQVKRFYKEEKPDVVIVAAAMVGGIMANKTFPADFIFRNLQIQNNLIWGAHENGVAQLIFLGSSCIYPRLAPQPMPESCLLQGDLERTNRPYAIAKIAGLELVHSLRQQFKLNYFSVMPTNLYGPRDNFHPENSHVIPGLIRRFCEAVNEDHDEVVIWGSGSPLREFLHARDCASAIVHLAEILDRGSNDPFCDHATWSHINIGSGQELSIAELAENIKKAAGFKGRLTFDASKPDGTPRKLLDSTLLKSFGWKPRITLEDGLSETIEWFRQTYGDC